MAKSNKLFKKNETVVKFDAGYDIGLIEVVYDEYPPCRRCATVDAPRLVMDSSGGEYGPGSLCFSCIDEIRPQPDISK